MSSVLSWTRSGVIAIAALIAVPLAAPAAPIGPVTAPADTSMQVTPVRGDGHPGQKVQRRVGPANWYKKRDMRRDRRGDSRYERQQQRRHMDRYRDRGSSPGIILEFSFPGSRR